MMRRCFRLTLACVAFVFAGLGCGRSEESAVVLVVPEPVVEPTDEAGVVRGSINFVGDAPGPRGVPGAFCFEGGGDIFYEDLVITDDGRIANVAVWLVPKDPGVALPEARDREQVVLDQEGCQFRPRVLTLDPGEPLLIASSDATPHTVYYDPQKNEAGYLALQPGDEPIERSFADPEIIAMRCDVHPWMRAFALVLDTPLHATTGETGSFEITGVPPATYTLHLWHELLGTSALELTVAPSSGAAVTYSMTAPTMPR